ncbi:MAG: radical SAM protein [Candidatus Bathyarchaeia archaeon]
MTSIKTLLINVQGPSTYPHLGCAHLLSSLKSAGHEVDFLDLAFVKDARQGRRKLLEKLSSNQFSLVGFSLNEKEESYKMAFDLAKNTKTSYGLPVIFGGALFGHPELCVEYLSLPFVDFVASGDGELTLPRLVEALNRPKLEEVPGLWRKTKNGKIIAPRTESSIEDLDSVPYPCYDDFNLQEYSPALPILTSRGCPWGKCRFCNDIAGAACHFTYRERSAENVFAELSYLKRKYSSVKIFPWNDQMICFNLTRLREICDLIRESDLEIFWAGGIYSMPGLGREVFQDMFSAGCRAISFGVESGSQRILWRMLKGTTVKTNERIIKDANRAGLKVRTGFIVEYPGETREDVEKTIAFLRKTIDYIDSVTISPFSLRLGSHIQRHIEEYVPAGLLRDIKRPPFTTKFAYPVKLKREHVESVQRLEEFVEDAGKQRELTVCGYNVAYFQSRDGLRSALRPMYARGIRIWRHSFKSMGYLYVQRLLRRYYRMRSRVRL